MSEWVWSFTKFNFKLMLKVSAFYLEKQKIFIPKKNIFLAVVSKCAKRDPKDGVSCPNFQWRFWCRDPVCGKKHLTSAAVIFTWPFQIIDTHQPPPVFSAKIAFKNHMNFIQITSRIVHCTAIITLWLPHVLMAKQKKMHLLCVI